MDYSLRGSSVQGIIQVRTLKRIVILSSRGKQPRDRTCISYVSCINILCGARGNTTWEDQNIFTASLKSLVDSVQFSSVTQLCPALCDPMHCSTPGFPVHHQLRELTQTHVHRVNNLVMLKLNISGLIPILKTINGCLKYHIQRDSKVVSCLSKKIT